MINRETIKDAPIKWLGKSWTSNNLKKFLHNIPN